MDSGDFRLFRALPPDGGCLAKVVSFVPDRPGSLAALAGMIGDHGVNITTFHYNRSEHPHRVAWEGEAPTAEALGGLRDLLQARGLQHGGADERLELGVIDAQSILKLRVSFADRPGTLATFAQLLRDHGANVIFISFDRAVSPAAGISLVTADRGEIDRLLKDLNERGWHYAIEYKGAGQREIDDLIGLNLLERFYFRLQRVLGTDDTGRLKRLVDSSRRLSETLAAFSREAGRHLEAGEVLTAVLAFASASRTRTGERFSWRRLPPLVRGGVTLHVFRLPTGANTSLLEGGGELVLVDGGYGLYYGDVKRMLRENGFEPSAVRRIYLTHADADHAGLSGHFAAEFGSRVFLHPAARAILEAENRASGSATPLLDLNRCFTVLVNEFTAFRVPGDWTPLGGGPPRMLDGFRVIDRFSLAGEEFLALESSGGHIPGQVFFLGPETGLVFSGDFLLRVESLTEEERAILNLPREMMTSTNADSRLFRQEMESLRAAVLALHGRLRARGIGAVVVPGHGDYYAADLL